MAERGTVRVDAVLIALMVAASTKIEAGKMVGINSAGYAVEASDASAIKVIGVAIETADNSSGANAAINVKVWHGKGHWFANSDSNAVDIADIGTLCFVEDDETVADDPGTNGIVAGRVLDVDSSQGVLVHIPAGIPQMANQADSAASDTAGIVSDFNDLLALLQSSGLMRSA